MTARTSWGLTPCSADCCAMIELSTDGAIECGPSPNGRKPPPLQPAAAVAKMMTRLTTVVRPEDLVDAIRVATPVPMSGRFGGVDRPERIAIVSANRRLEKGLSVRARSRPPARAAARLVAEAEKTAYKRPRDVTWSAPQRLGAVQTTLARVCRRRSGSNP